jgi:hypothetical protein
LKQRWRAEVLATLTEIVEAENSFLKLRDYLTNAVASNLASRVFDCAFGLVSGAFYMLAIHTELLCRYMSGDNEEALRQFDFGAHIRWL